MTRPVLFGLAGLGGYAAGVCDTLLQESAVENPLVKLHAVCEPNQAGHADRITRLRQQGIHVFSHYEQLLAEPIEAVWLPLPIHLHRPFTEQALLARKAVICEKPAAGCIDDVDAMILAQQRANLPVAIGYQDIFAPHAIAVKRRLLDGRIGRPLAATLMVCWPRGDDYYSRNAWAGALRREGAWVLDSPVNNAAAHYLNLAFFLLGADEQSAAEPRSVVAELYRARPIENFDTVAMRLMLPGELPLTVLMTHACRATIHPRLKITGSEGVADLTLFDRAEIRRGDGVETIRLEQDNRHHVPRAFARWMRGLPLETAVATLPIARPHAVAVSGASQAVEVRDVPSEFVDATTSDSQLSVLAIRNIESIFQRCAAEAKLLSELPDGVAGWAVKPGQMDLRGYRHFAGPARGG